MAKLEAIIVKCGGAAHANPYIDNCAVCMPYWEFYPTCPTDAIKLKGSKGSPGDYCRTCHKHFLVPEGVV